MVLSRFRAGGVASDNVAVHLAVRSVFWGAYVSIRNDIECHCEFNLGQDVIGDGERAASHRLSAAIATAGTSRDAVQWRPPRRSGGGG